MILNKKKMLIIHYNCCVNTFVLLLIIYQCQLTKGYRWMTKLPKQKLNIWSQSVITLSSNKEKKTLKKGSKKKDLRYQNHHMLIFLHLPNE